MAIGLPRRLNNKFPIVESQNMWSRIISCVSKRFVWVGKPVRSLLVTNSNDPTDLKKVQRCCFLILSFALASFIMLCTLRLRMPQPVPYLNETRVLHAHAADKTIPLRIHQMYRDTYIPHVYVSYVKSWLKHHPNYEYWFWTDEDIRRFIADYYPQFLNMFDSYSNNLLRSDAARYFILYHYGGVYADMDMESFRPLDKFIKRHTCVLSREPNLQSVMLYDKPSVAMNAWMACTRKHQFMRYLINSLPMYNRRIEDIGQTIYVTGPHMLHETLMRYNRTANCTEGQLNCQVYVAPFEMFMPTWDKIQRKNFRTICKIWLFRLSIQQLLACQWLQKTNFSNPLPSDVPYVYGNHNFLHIGYRNGLHKDAKAVDLKKVAPGALRYDKNQLPFTTVKIKTKSKT